MAPITLFTIRDERVSVNCLAAAEAISHAVCFFRMKATARVAVITGRGVLTDSCVIWRSIDVRCVSVKGSSDWDNWIFERYFSADVKSVTSLGMVSISSCVIGVLVVFLVFGPKVGDEVLVFGRPCAMLVLLRDRVEVMVPLGNRDSVEYDELEECSGSFFQGAT